MKSLRDLSLFVSGAAAFALLLTACVKEPGEAPSPGDDGRGGEFDYSTRSEVNLNLDYSKKGIKALFEVYDRVPVAADENGVLRKKEGVRALLKAYTDKDSRYSGVIDLPSAAKKIYLYSETYGIPTCVEAEVTGNAVNFDFGSYIAGLKGDDAVSASVRSAAPGMFSDENPYNIRFLGGWDNNGAPDYLIGEVHNGYLYPILVEPFPDGLANRVQNVLLPGNDNSAYAKPTELVNVNVTKDAHVTLVFFTEMAAWRNAMGYYYYDTKNPPKTQADFEALPKYLAFPNCSMWSWNSGIVGGYMPPLWGGEQMKLVYYGQDGKAADVFPAGVTIGWFILPDGFEVSPDGSRTNLNITGSRHGIRYSNNEFNEGAARHCVSVYDAPSAKTIIGFEDSGDNDYKDVMFYIESDPVDAIYDPDRPTTEPGEEYPDVTGDPIEGTLAFEDLWPSQGDYDMNDVVVRYSTTFTTDRDNRLVAIKDVFTPLYNGGQYKSAFGYQLDIPVSEVSSVLVENGSSSAHVFNGGLEEKQDKAVIMLFDDLQQAVAGGPITVTVKLAGGLNMKDVTRSSLYNPFICVSAGGFVPGGLRKEIHLTDYAPTALADPYPFGRNDDKSTVDKEGQPTGPHYYVTSDLHPFAIDLPITDYRVPDEMVSIDVFYPQFAEWARSEGQKNKEWYLHPSGK